MVKRTYTIYLAKENIADFTQLLTENSVARLAAEQSQVLTIDDFAERASLYVFGGIDQQPVWAKQLAAQFPIRPISNKSSSAVLIFEEQGRVFAVSFGYGWMTLNTDRFIGDFGLRVSINVLDPSKLKHLERTNLGDALKGVALSPFQRGFETFGIDDALELVSNIGGTTNGRIAADSVSGSIACKPTGEYELTDLPELATELAYFYDSRYYADTAFRVIDVLSKVTSIETVEQLDQMAVQSIARGFDDFELGLPIDYLDGQACFRFKGPGVRGLHPDLLIRNYQQALGQELHQLSVDRLRSDRIEAVFDDPNKSPRSWSIRDGLVGSINWGSGRYAINEGKWYQLDTSFKASIDQSFSQIVQSWPNPPVPFRRVENTLQSEESYNRETSERLGYIFLDGKLISIPDLQRSQFEVCDILDVEGKRLIHVKKGSRKSSILSHFFKQGANSAQNLQKFAAAWPTVLEKMEADDDYSAAECQRLREAINGDMTGWTVEYWISDTQRSNGQFNIPFFSKITLRDEVSSLRAMQYNVVLRFIPQHPVHIPQR